MPAIVLSTLNARFIHTSLGLRCLLANLGELRADAALAEFVITDRPADVAEKVLALHPRILGLGVYVWNVEETARLVALLKSVRPELIVVLGGPEVSHEWEQQPITRLADYIVGGPGELVFSRLCRDILSGTPPAGRFLRAELPDLDALELPYTCYDDQDIAHRLIYVEASRGCPFKCEFCLSALDRTARPFETGRFLAAMEDLYRRGVRHFKFVDRTFNLNIGTSLRILEFFLDKADPSLFLHFEVIPDHLPDRLKEALARFPPGCLQLEIGVQSFDPEVQARISRRQDNAATEANLSWLRRHTHAHLHVDLIAGLPGETLEGFARGFDRLIALDPHEIQVGILKRLRGAPIDRHTRSCGMRYNPHPPYNVVRTDVLDFMALQRLNRFARYWDLVGNSGRFRELRTILLRDQPFARFMAFSDWLYLRTGKTHEIALDRLYDFVFEFLTMECSEDDARVRHALAADFRASGTRRPPRCLLDAGTAEAPRRLEKPATRRQTRHGRG
ncbi:B12-binding domain-containing radical SAM protein [Methylococcus capsulatus]|uniref:Putative oxygen-independent coproporphyrinogen III oxidase family protein n=1 Tax=Methylococcus capsulatus (strain ATCC 33009 / NCIMB 11132 / Bath) TaxID=243233 RepID=Q60AI7_METCA|nr:B12-binding domain-containing radical SAM protein [Methylococcus capsulatus]AAU93017.1 putative oxygen-independent coproporphyrinogen III oxidase family protein [Methylococcus capsulatus str. Bath]QXP90286.1 B12-binding domain-containing radical SAM protein [Methylococcus capsulatus]